MRRPARVTRGGLRDAMITLGFDAVARASDHQASLLGSSVAEGW
jgi:hypothetical protein